ncbi:MAG: T9SS type A sorting domain-containing protein [Bacteroidetes bacterium]|nr:T9SS type A sorting domain-containing protein [Bacteroidota bacterium]MBK9542453.1 T9SS type A sorting domain-containing protein [Bacteroidota bacterium]MBP6402031.1 T9SS type A sorting domain-containing protein [Bacteroidia bacterium]MBP6649954.1 T9SS type A sorting domain-containing protein [Bacteroidia bacterium]
MKKLYLLLFCLSSLAVNAQPNITVSDLPVVGLAFTMGTDSLFTGTIPAAGANQNWNLSTLLNRLTDTSGFMSSAGTPYAGTFNTSNLAAYDDETNSYSYFTSGTNGFFINGLGSPSMNYILQPAQCFIPVPFTFGDQQTNVARNVIDTSYTDSTGTTYFLRNVVNITSVFNADGYGTLTLPNGVLNNTLRVKITETRYDSLFSLIGPLQILIGSSASQTTHYRWFQPGNQAAYVLGIEADSLGTSANFSEYLLASIILNVPQTRDISALELSPNPARDKIIISGLNISDAGFIYLYSSTGALIDRFAITNTRFLSLDVSKLQNGLYYIQSDSHHGNHVAKFMVSH